MFAIYLNIFLSFNLWSNYTALENKLVLTAKSSEEWQRVVKLLPRIEYLHKNCQQQIKARVAPHDCWLLLEIKKREKIEQLEVDEASLVRHCLLHLNQDCSS